VMVIIVIIKKYRKNRKPWEKNVSRIRREICNIFISKN
jgi:hypothetical protein